MWAGNLLVANRPRKLSLSSTGDDDHTWLTKNASPRIATRRRPLSSKRRKLPASARQRRVALSRMASKMGCKSCGELAMARSTSEMAVCCSMSSVTRSCSSEAVFPPAWPFATEAKVSGWSGIDAELLNERTSLGRLNCGEAEIIAAIMFADHTFGPEKAYTVEQDQTVWRVHASPTTGLQCLTHRRAVSSSQAFGSKGAGRRSAPWRASIQPG